MVLSPSASCHVAVSSPVGVSEPRGLAECREQLPIPLFAPAAYPLWFNGKYLCKYHIRPMYVAWDHIGLLEFIGDPMVPCMLLDLIYMLCLLVYQYHNAWSSLEFTLDLGTC